MQKRLPSCEGMCQLSTVGATRQMKRSAREGVIVEAAAELFPENGIEPVKMTDVATASGVGVASLYRYFGTKVNLALETGALLWRRFCEHFTDNLTKEFDGKTGYAQMEELFGLYSHMYSQRPQFIAFLDELDHMVLMNEVDPDRLASYEAEIMRFYPLYLASFERGVEDGSIRSDVDFPLFYLTCSHSLMGVAQKLIRGDILPSDDFAQGSAELKMAVDVVLNYLKA